MWCAAIGGPDSVGSSPDHRERMAALAGFEVKGRIGALGVVVAPEDDDRVEEVGAVLLVIGGRSSLLHFYIPLERVTDVSRKARSLSVDVDVVDFTPRVGDDGTVELHLGG